MRAIGAFRRTHVKLLQAILGDGGPDAGELGGIALVELCLRYVDLHLEQREVEAVPHLLLGYDGLVASFTSGEAALRRLANLRHVAFRLGSIAGWNEALRAHAAAPQALRSYDVVEGRVRLRRTAAPKLLASLDAALDGPVPWAEQSVTPAAPGEYRVRANHNQSVLGYTVPPVTVPAPTQYAFRARRRHAAIHLSMADLITAARDVDEREAAVDWPEALKPLRLAGRLADVRLEGTAPGFWDAEGGRLTLEGVTHLVGMLSSGKSTLVWGLLFGLTRDRARPYRVAMMATDTVQAAAYATRMRLHGIPTTVLSSAHRRARHLEGIHWQQASALGGAGLQSVGEAVEGFGTACPLDGFQPEARVVQGAVRGGNRDFPALDEKPCHGLQPIDAPADNDGEEPEDLDDEQGRKRRRSCPLWSRCPLQSQQRDAVTASVLILTPEAFAHMAPDAWVSDRRLTIPELLQFEADVVLVDEVDAVQKRLDAVFAPLAPIMGDEREVFLPSVGRQTAEALRKRSGAQFRNPVNTRWQSNFFNFFRLVGVMYAMLQAEEHDLRPFYGDGPFTAGSLLHDLRRLMHRRDNTDGGPADAEFLQVASVAAGIARTAMADEEGASAGTGRPDLEPSFRKAADALVALAGSAFRADDYRPLLDGVTKDLDGPLVTFRAVGGRVAGRRTLDDRGNALVLLLAVVADLVLWHYHWLVRSQAAVARDLGMDDGALFGPAANLGKHYRTLLPNNPAGSLLGLQYDAPQNAERNLRGGRLTLVNHLGVGRHLLCHLHDLMIHEGQAGPHVLLLSGTSWAGGGILRRFPGLRDPERRDLAEVASPVYDVQVPVKGILRQPDEEVEAIGRSVFRLTYFRNAGGPGAPATALRASGLPQPRRREALAEMTRRLAERKGATNRFEKIWDEMERTWPDGDMADRRRAMLVVNSYADAQAVAGVLSSALPPSREAAWHVRCLVPDRDDPDIAFADGLRDVEKLPRALVERFGETPERSILVAPLNVVARGHNILNGNDKAAISSIYFLHRPHPRPDDLSAAVGRLNRYAIARFDRPVDPDRYAGLAACARAMRHQATDIVREAMDNRGGFSTLPPHLKAAFAWDMLTPLWQAIGRGIRGGVPVFVGFVDRQFAPLAMDGAGKDTPEGSSLVLAARELEQAMDPAENPDAHVVAHRLYGPFLEALRRTEGLSR